MPAYSAFLSRCVVNLPSTMTFHFIFLTQQKFVFFFVFFAGLVAINAMTTGIYRRRPGYTAVTGWQPTTAAKSGSGKGGGGGSVNARIPCNQRGLRVGILLRHT